MPQTKDGAEANEWIAYMRRCAEVYHESKTAAKAKAAKQQVAAERAKKKRVVSGVAQALKAEAAAQAKAKKVQQVKHRQEVHSNVKEALRRTPGPATMALKQKQARQAG